MAHHFARVAPWYDVLRVTDEEPLEVIEGYLPFHAVTGVDLGSDTGHYAQFLLSRLPLGSQMLAIDLNPLMLRILAGKAAHAKQALQPVYALAERLPLRPSSVDCVTCFNAIHHFDVPRFLPSASQAVRPNGLIFIYTRTPEQNARSISGR